MRSAECEACNAFLLTPHSARATPHREEGEACPYRPILLFSAFSLPRLSRLPSRALPATLPQCFSACVVFWGAI